jgi:hypothetical protein
MQTAARSLQGTHLRLPVVRVQRGVEFRLVQDRGWRNLKDFDAVHRHIKVVGGVVVCERRRPVGAEPEVNLCT